MRQSGKLQIGPMAVILKFYVQGIVCPIANNAFSQAGHENNPFKGEIH